MSHTVGHILPMNPWMEIGAPAAMVSASGVKR
jgi:hypothetical protein